jgi:hypothetical protein
VQLGSGRFVSTDERTMLPSTNVKEFGLCGFEVFCLSRIDYFMISKRRGTKEGRRKDVVLLLECRPSMQVFRSNQESNQGSNQGSNPLSM